MDRLYIDVKDLIEFDFYKTSRMVSYAAIDGEEISHTKGAKLLATKVYVDVKTNEIVSDSELLIELAMKHFELSEQAEIKEDEKAEDQKMLNVQKEEINNQALYEIELPEGGLLRFVIIDENSNPYSFGDELNWMLSSYEETSTNTWETLKSGENDQYMLNNPSSYVDAEPLTTKQINYLKDNLNNLEIR